jgi:hypothetical protein
MILVGNKVDLEVNREVATMEGAELAKSEYLSSFSSLLSPLQNLISHPPQIGKPSSLKRVQNQERMWMKCFLV